MYENTIKEFFSSINSIRKLKYKHRICDLSHVEFFMMGAIYSGRKEKFFDQKSENGMKVSDLNGLMKGSKSATSKMLRNLEEKEYIIRISDNKDKRNVYIKLSEKGEETLLKSREKMSHFAKVIIDKMGIEDVEQLIYLMNKLFKVMEEEMKEKTDGKDTNL